MVWDASNRLHGILTDGKIEVDQESDAFKEQATAIMEQSTATVGSEQVQSLTKKTKETFPTFHLAGGGDDLVEFIILCKYFTKNAETKLTLERCLADEEKWGVNLSTIKAKYNRVSNHWGTRSRARSQSDEIRISVLGDMHDSEGFYEFQRVLCIYVITQMQI